MFKKICDKQDTVIIKNLECIYFYYFIPIILKNSYQISYNGDGLLITDDYTDSADNQIFIGSKFSNVYPESKNGLFYSYTLNQFLLKNVVSDSKKIIGKLMKFYKIETLENSKVLIYNGNVLKMPKTYNFISESMLAITKKNSKITIKNNFSQINGFNNIEKYYNDYEFSKLLFFKCIAVPSNKILENLFKIVINTFPQLDAKNYQEINSNNIYSFNNGLAPQFSIFSLYVLGNNIVIQISRNFLSIEKQLIKLVDSNLNNLFQHKDITVEPISNMQNFKKIHIISEMRFMIQVFTKIFPFLVRNFFDANISNNNNYYNVKRKQYVYTFSQSEIALIKKKSEKYGLKPINLIRSSIIKAIYNLFENHLVLFGNSSGNYVIPKLVGDVLEINKNITYNLRSRLGQKFIVNLIFSYLRHQHLKHFYPPTFINLDEIEIDSCKTLTFEKVNMSCKSYTFPVQVAYYFNHDKFNLTISCIDTIGKIRYLVPELTKIIC